MNHEISIFFVKPLGILSHKLIGKFLLMYKNLKLGSQLKMSITHSYLIVIFLLQVPRHMLSYEGGPNSGKATIRIPYVNESIAGNYTCTARNKNGIDTFVQQVQVRNKNDGERCR